MIEKLNEAGDLRQILRRYKVRHNTTISRRVSCLSMVLYDLD